MLQATVLFAIIGVIAAQPPPPGLSSTCAVTLCIQGTVCKEVYNPVTGVVTAACLSNVQPGNENVCPSGQPLYVNSSTLGVVQINCGRSPDRIDCVHGYYCNIDPLDRYAVCCPEEVSTGTTCANFPCPRGTQCIIDSPVCQCVRAPCPCPTAPRCIPVTNTTPIPRPSCLTVKCSAGFQCEMVLPADCIWRKPCWEEPQCVPVATPKEGACPAVRVQAPNRFNNRPWCRRRCETDSDCPRIQKCCTTPLGCGTSCQEPQPEITCANVDCQPNQVCVMQQVQCIRAPCFPVPTCITPTVPERPGQCPAPSGLVGICVFDPNRNCLSDNACPAGQKCCEEGCGKVCKAIVQG